MAATAVVVALRCSRRVGVGASRGVGHLVAWHQVGGHSDPVGACDMGQGEGRHLQSEADNGKQSSAYPC
jgi:hypothetical protein